MNPIERDVLGALLRLARRRQAAEESEIALRVGASPSEVRASLRRLRSLGLAQITAADAEEVSLTLQGLAVAIALLPRRMPRPARQTRRHERAA
jgi:Mn-dependent DtxR family transcriptional regulator